MSGPFENDRVAYYLSPGGGDDTLNIQSALNAAVASGGLVYLNSGVFHISNTLHVAGSNVAIQGAGIGKTVIQGTTATYPGYAGPNGVQAYAALALVAASHCSVRDLTVDHFTHSVDANGIIMVPDGASGAGTICTDCQVMDCEVLSVPNHSYQIWSQRGQSIKILRNYVNGNYNPTGDAATDPDYEGIEVMGGYDVLVADNTLENLSTGIYVWGTAGIAGGDARYVRVCGNYSLNVDCAVKFTPAYTSSISTGVYDLLVRGNHVNGALYCGILGQVTEASAVAQDIEIVSNQIASSLMGIWMDNQLTSGTLTRCRVNGNTVTGATSATLGAISVQYISASQIADNIVDNSGGYGLWALESTTLDIGDNTVVSCGKSALVMNTVSNSRIHDNLFQGYNALGGGTNAIPLTACTNLDIVRNAFSLNGSAEVYAVQMGSDSAGIRLKDNRLLYIPTFASPFNNASTNPWEFDVVIAASSASTSVAHNMAVYSGVRLAVTQIAGVAQPVTVTISGGDFVFTLAAATTAAVTYRAEIVQ